MHCASASLSLSATTQWLPHPWCSITPPHTTIGLQLSHVAFFTKWSHMGLKCTSFVAIQGHVILSIANPCTRDTVLQSLSCMARPNLACCSYFLPTLSAIITARCLWLVETFGCHCRYGYFLPWLDHVEVQVWAGIPILTPASPLDSMLAMPTNHECTYLHAFTYCTRTSCLFDHIWLQDEGRLGEFTRTSP